MGIEPMTYKEAARILDPETNLEALRVYAGDCEARQAAVVEACRMGARALREKPTGEPLSFDQLRELDDQRSVEDWLKCCICCDTCIYNSLPGYEKPCSDCQESGELASWTAKYQYCPKCGRPLTNEAYALLEKRLRG